MMMVNAALERVYKVELDPQAKAQIIEDLKRPFDIEDIKWKPQQVRRAKPPESGKQGQAIAFADPRAYIDRLNEVLGPDQWFNFSEVLVSNEFGRKTMSYENGQRTENITPAAKLVCTVSVGILGLGFHTEVGEEWLDDDNAHTSAFAQAFKRACLPFGLGRYMYDLPKRWYPMDDNGKFFIDPGPQLPNWAYPVYPCQRPTCQKHIEAGVGGGRDWSVRDVRETTKKRFGRELCFDCWRLASQELKARQSSAAVAPAVAPVVANGHTN